MRSHKIWFSMKEEKILQPEHQELLGNIPKIKYLFYPLLGKSETSFSLI